MSFASALPPDLLAAVDPLGRGPPGLPRPPAPAAGAGPPLASFELVLQLLGGESLPAGDPLPDGGNDLPTAADLGRAGDRAENVLATPLQLVALAASDAAPSAASDYVSMEPASPRSSPPAAASPVAAPASDTRPPPVAAPAWPATPPAPKLVDAASDAAPASAPAPEPAPAPVSSSPDAPISDAARAQRAMLPRLGLEAQDSAPASDVARTRTRTAELLEPRGRPEVVLPAEAAAQTPARETLVEPSSRFDQAIATAAQARPSVKDVAALIQAGPADVAASTPASVDSGASAPAHVAASLAAPPSATGSAATSAAASSTHHPQQPLDTRADRWQDALASRIQWLVDHDVGEARIKLNPPELGALDVRVSLLDDKTFVQMTAHAATARDELVQSLPRLRELLTAGGLDLGGATVTGGRDERASQHAALEPLTRAARFAEAAHEAPAERAGALVARAVSRIDTFA